MSNESMFGESKTIFGYTLKFCLLRDFSNFCVNDHRQRGINGTECCSRFQHTHLAVLPLCDFRFGQVRAFSICIIKSTCERHSIWTAWVNAKQHYCINIPARHLEKMSRNRISHARTVKIDQPLTAHTTTLGSS